MYSHIGVGLEVTIIRPAVQGKSYNAYKMPLFLIKTYWFFPLSISTPLPLPNATGLVQGQALHPVNHIKTVVRVGEMARQLGALMALSCRRPALSAQHPQQELTTSNS